MDKKRILPDIEGGSDEYSEEEEQNRRMLLKDFMPFSFPSSYVRLARIDDADKDPYDNCVLFINPNQ